MSPKRRGGSGLRILILNYEYPPLGGGSSPATQDLVESLAGLGHEVHVITSGFRGVPAREAGPVRVIRVPVLRRHLGYSNALEMTTYILSGGWRALMECRRRRYDIVHAQFLIPTGIIAWLIRLFFGVPYFVTAHGSDVPGYDPESFVIWSHRLIRPLWLRIVRSAEAVICASEYLGKLMRKAAPGVKLERVPYGAHPPEKTGGLRRHRILVVSRFFRRKGIGTLLKLLDRVDADWEVDVVGDGPCRDELHEATKELKMPVRFWGWIARETPEYGRFFEDASIFVFLSLSENFPIVLLDAMRYGLPVLASGIPSNRDLLGEAAVYVDPKRQEDIRTRLLRLMKDPALRKSLSRKGRERTSQHFTWRRVAVRHQELYLRAAGP